ARRPPAIVWLPARVVFRRRPRPSVLDEPRSLPRGVGKPCVPAPPRGRAHLDTRRGIVSVDDRLASLGLELPGPYPPHDPLDAVVVHNGRARTSGQLPRNHVGALVNPGTLGLDVTVDEGADAAKWCALNALSVLRAELGTLDSVERVLTVLGFVACVQDFDQQAAVVD